MAGKCVTYTSKDAKQVKLDDQIRDESVTPALILTSDSSKEGPEVRLLSMISDLKLKNTSLQEEC